LPPLEPPFPEPTPPSPTPSCEKVVFRDGFWTGTINVDRVNYDQNDYTWTELPLEMPGKSTATVVADPAGSGQLVGRFVVPDDGESFRAEVHRRRFDWGHYRYAISHYIPSDFARFRYDTIISQWHGYPMQDANGKNVSLNPPIALSVYGADPRWVLNTNLLASTNPPKAATTHHPIDVPIAYDRWNDWVFDITWSRLLADGTVTPGLIVVTLNGQEVLRIAGDNNYHQQWPPYFQMGIYRPNWRAGPNRGPSGGPPVVVYHGNMSVSDLNGCTAASAP
ncbi:heparin lyase I family protein, partial [Lysobacter enzymogenes]|uniref:heparin lyase I family protein n=1 Tax=Lysobacter enzymogenes TaxID=69 RepID=UPI00197B10CB